MDPQIDIEKSMKYGTMRYKKNQGPKQDWNCNMLQRSMIGDEALLKEGLAIKDNNMLKRQDAQAKKELQGMKHLTEENFKLGKKSKPAPSPGIKNMGAGLKLQG